MFLLPKDYYEIRTVKNKGRGVFAKRDISGGSVIGDYLGTFTRADDVEEKESGFHDLIWTDRTLILPDHTTPGIHFINSSCAPNCAMFPYKEHTLYFAVRKIFAEEELTISYLLGEPDEETIVEPCHCGTPVCRGTLHNSNAVNHLYEAFVAEKDHKYAGKTHVRYGKQLEKLPEYPVSIADYPLYDIFGTLDKPSFSYTQKKFPELKDLRQLIREQGRKIKLDQFGITVYGIMNGLIVAMPK